MNTIHSAKVDWTKFRYMAFDLPNHRGSYRERYAELGIFRFSYKKPLSYKYQKVNRLSNKEGKYVKIAGTETCNGMDHLEKFFQDIIDRGGEGIILRDPDSPFQHGRSSGYLKHKVRSITLACTTTHNNNSAYDDNDDNNEQQQTTTTTTPPLLLIGDVFQQQKYRDAEARILGPVGTHQWECEL